MEKRAFVRSAVAGAATALTLTMICGSATADHAWANYHWARSSNPFTLRLGDNVSSAWDSYLQTASSDWSVSNVLDTTIVAGATTPRTCRAARYELDFGRGFKVITHVRQARCKEGATGRDGRNSRRDCDIGELG